ncbi:MAG: TlpA family protein disulfide reductase [Planctomycetes bacterium]|nr:TlpA family protein disulfide reductase [Planctomycetota bacterium]
MAVGHLNDLLGKYGQQGFVIVAITDEDRGAVEAFSQAIPIKYPVGLDADRRTSDAYGIEGIPSAFLMDATGKVVWEGHPLMLEEEQINALLAAVPKTS